jgi:hypothetical protein
MVASSSFFLVRRAAAHDLVHDREHVETQQAAAGLLVVVLVRAAVEDATQRTAVAAAQQVADEVVHHRDLLDDPGHRRLVEHVVLDAAARLRSTPRPVPVATQEVVADRQVVQHAAQRAVVATAEQVPDEFVDHRHLLDQIADRIAAQQVVDHATRLGHAEAGAGATSQEVVHESSIAGRSSSAACAVVANDQVSGR